MVFWLLFSGWLVTTLLGFPRFMEQVDSTGYYFPIAADFHQRVGIWAMMRDGFRGPGYLALLALLTSLAGSVPEAGFWLRLVCWPLFLGLAYLVARQATDSRVALGMVLLLSLSPGTWVELKTIGSDAPFLVLMYAALLLAMTKAGLVSGQCADRTGAHRAVARALPGGRARLRESICLVAFMEELATVGRGGTLVGFGVPGSGWPVSVCKSRSAGKCFL